MNTLARALHLLVTVSAIALAAGCSGSSVDVQITTLPGKPSEAGCEAKFTVTNNTKERLEDFYISFDGGGSKHVFSRDLRIGESYSNGFYVRRSSCAAIRTLPREIKCRLSKSDCSKSVVVRFTT